MDEIIEQDPKKEEKKAFYVGLATITCLIFIIVLVIFFLRGCSGQNNKVKEATDNNTETKEAIGTSQAPVANSVQGEVAGEKITPSPAAAVTAVNGKKYTVQSGDTLYEIGKKFKVDWKKIAEANGIENSAALKVGKEIIIPSE